MDSPQREIREFLMTRRARLTPEQAGLPTFGGRRRVDGLRREEVALLAGISTEYYTRLERGNAAGVSDSVLDAISRALQLDDAEHEHLHDLVKAALALTGVGPRRPVARSQQIPASVRQLIDAMRDVAVIVQNGRGDVVASNTLGRALYPWLRTEQHRVPNFSRFVFLDPTAHDFYVDWNDAAHQTVALLRSEVGRSPNDRALMALVGELSTRSDAFCKLWAAHDVRQHRTGIKKVQHPFVGELEVSFEGLQITNAPGLLLLAYSAQPGTTSHERMQLLANWGEGEPSPPSVQVEDQPAPYANQ
jgi:transcriptional regulator with XRE-family HTH domain